MSISSRKISELDDWMYLRISADAEHLLVYQYQPNSKEWLTLYKNEDEFRFLQTIPHKKEARDNLAPVFDISPNGRYLAICYHETPFAPDGSDGMVCYIWDSIRKIYLQPFIHQNISGKTYTIQGWEGVFSGDDYLTVRFLSDNDRLITVTVAGEIFVWSLTQEKFLWSVSAAAHRAKSVAFSNNLRFFAMSEHLGHYRGGQIGLLRTRHDKIYYVTGRSKIFPNPKTTSEPFEEGDFLSLWDIYSGALIREFEADSSVTELVFSHNDKLIAGSMNNTSFIWNVNTGEVVDALPENTKPIAFTANDDYLITIHAGNTIALWEIQAKQWKQRFEVDGLISSAQVSQTDKVVALAKTVNDWQLHQIQI